jgi:hypothetical protein
VLNGDYSGASNASQIDHYSGNDSKTTYDSSLKLNDIGYHASNLNLSEVSNKNFDFTYWASYSGYSLDDLYINVIYNYSYATAHTQENGQVVTSSDENLYYTTNYKLSEYQNGFIVYPYSLLVDSMGMDSKLASACCGGYYTHGLNSQLSYFSTSLLRVSFQLCVVNNGKISKSSAKAYSQVVNLLTGDCEFYYSNVDEDTDEYVTDSDYYKTSDSKGNVTINNNNTGGGSSGGGSSSNATGGTSSAEGGTASASANVGDITNNNTFTFPDKIQIDLNVNGIEGSSSTSGSSGSDSDSDKSWWDKLLDAISSFLNFLAGVVTNLFETIGNLIETFADGVSDFILYIFEGFGLFAKEGGMSDLLQENLSFLPSEVWQLVMFGLSSAILVAIIRRFWK